MAFSGEFDQLRTLVDQVGELLRTVEKKLDQIARDDKRVGQLMQIDGVHRVTADATVATIDDAIRFRSGR